MVRVVGGALGGRRLETAGADAVRPTSDRAREAIFNMLVGLELPGGAMVLDLFAGSGALGIEALSRDAAHATFVDSDAAACRTISTNLTALGISDRATVVRSDAGRFLAAHSEPVDLAFADPPYRFDRWSDLLDTVNAGVLVCESDREIEPGSNHAWQTHRSRRYGTPVITILLRSDSTDSSAAGASPSRQA
ncbi:16S rRNA (guanine(966)-N(2))-methyltransferase RsmD [Candidatus Poriferisodalis sp.]|uniref:16S rRNA (guanine(966)-N(2))-methyltransferase RsmD n=1 Tax=Candidatus Poriferisodalis sp. TaxID=3101277 RepID=UPI003B02CE41